MSTPAPICTMAELLTYLGRTTSISDSELGLVNDLWPKAEKKIVTVMQQDPRQQTYTEYYPDKNLVPLYEELVDAGLGVYDAVGGRAVPFLPYQAGNTIQVRNLPLRSVTALYEDVNAKAGQQAGSFAAGTLLTPGDMYWLDWDTPESSPGAGDGISKTGHIYRVTAVWPSVPRSVKVTYVAGWTTAEFDTAYPNLKEAVQITVDHSIALAKAWRKGKSGPVTSESLADWSASYANHNFGLAVPAEALRLIEPYIRMSIL